jgi:Zn-dependent protease
MAEAVGPRLRHGGSVAAERPPKQARIEGSGTPQNGFKLGRIAGIELRVDWSLAIVFWLIAVNLGAGMFPAMHPNWSPALRWSVALAASVLFFASVLTHELAHALVGRARGVPVQGITLFIFGGVARLAGEPKSPSTEFLMAIVGPLTSFVIGIGCLLIGGAISGDTSTAERGAAEFARRLGPAASALMWLGTVNILLAIFNCLPGFPLDGGRVLRSAIWAITGSLRKAARWASGVGRLLAMALIVTGVMMAFGYRVPYLGAGLIQGLWLVFIGWFLNSAALRSYQQVIVAEVLQDVPVSRVMRKNPGAVPPDLSVSALVDRFLQSSDRCFPVTDGHALQGLVCETDLRKIPRDTWNTGSVRDIMTPANALITAHPDENVVDTLRKLAENDVDQLPVLQDGQLQGLLRRSDIIRWLELSGTTGREV